ncbi:rhamnogalacturonan acetylesterase [Bacteroidales bacterium OttesenSCG-928-A17]|nr:rhamnogalacturonan acetylesterase [Bacteroidales bacterium OttesenSCG-928-A17]
MRPCFHKTIRLLILSSLFLCFACNNNRPVHIFLAGDSTMADKDIYRSIYDSIAGDSIRDVWPERGWGMLLPEFFNDQIIIENHAKNGRSTRSFRYEGRWDSLMHKVQKGDYVVIQFGHNDGSEAKVERYATPIEYQWNLDVFIREVKEKGGIPILCTPVVRRKFDEKSNFVDTHGIYPDIVRETAQKHQIVLIDMYEKSKELLIQTGEEASKELFMHIPPGYTNILPNGLEDNTHYQEKGARLTASLFIEGLTENNITDITRYLKE